MTQHFTVDGRLPGYNELKAQNWQASYRLKKEAMERVSVFIRAAKTEPVKGKIVFRLQCFEPNMKRDEDNVMFGACKIILDALQQLGILPNDNRRWVRLDLLPVRVDRERPRIEVTLEENAGQAKEG